MLRLELVVDIEGSVSIASSGFINDKVRVLAILSAIKALKCSSEVIGILCEEMLSERFANLVATKEESIEIDFNGREELT